MTRARYYVGLTTKEYAAAHGISERTARRRVASIPGATKSGRGWKVPIPASDYARRTGKSAKTVRKQGFATTDIASEMAKKYPAPIRKQAVDHRATLLAGKANVSPQAIMRRIGGATPAQLRTLLAVTRETDLEYKDPFWADPNTGQSIVWYHP